jgi:predicted Zn-dependent peptidase
LRRAGRLRLPRTPRGAEARALPAAADGRVARLAGRSAYDPTVQNWTLTELDSGERVISERLEHARSTAIGYWINAGSRDETESKAGVSHFIEHLLFKGTPTYTALEIAEIFDGIGAELNASTSRENTLVYSRVPSQHVEKALDVIGEMVFAPLFAELDSEREVVLEEIAMYEDAPPDLVHDLIAEAVFGSLAIGRPVIGTAEVITKITRRTVSAYHRTMYTPANVVVAAAGDVDHAHLVELVSRAAAARGETADGSPRVRPPIVKLPGPGLRFQAKETEQYHVCLGAPGIAISDRRRFAASILDAVLGGSASSRLFQEIRERRGMAYSVYSFASQFSDTGQIGVYLGTREDNLADALAITAEQIADVAAGGLTAREFERAKENIKGRVLLSMESASAHMNRLGRAVISDSEILSLDRVMSEIDAVEADAVCELAAVLLAPERLSVAGIGPDEQHFLEAVAPVTPALAQAA